MDKEDKNIIGMRYIPHDNSWCINLKTHTRAYITPGYSITEGENGATFTIISMPYEEEIPNYESRTFINVESNKTKNIYKVLYNANYIIKDMNKEIKIIPPEGYEIDKENSTFDCIKFKRNIQNWATNINKEVKGYFIDTNSIILKTNGTHYNTFVNYNVFATKAQAKSALAMARISQIMANDKRFGGVVTDEEWNDSNIYKYTIERFRTNVQYTSSYTTTYKFLAFHTNEQRDLFLKENEDLVKDYFMID